MEIRLFGSFIDFVAAIAVSFDTYSFAMNRTSIAFEHLINWTLTQREKFAMLTSEN